MNHRLSVIVVGSLLSLGLCSVAHAQSGTPTQPPPAAPALPAPASAPAASGASEGQVAPAAAPLAAPDPEEEPPRKAHNVVFLELGGNGLVYSINYERLIDDTDFSLRVGASYISVGASSSTSSAKASIMTFPVLGNYYVGSKNHKLQLGAGLTFMQITLSGSGTSFVEASGFVPAPTAVIGYRYIPARGGFAFSVGLTPFIIPGGDKVFYPWGGISFGGIF